MDVYTQFLAHGKFNGVIVSVQNGSEHPWDLIICFLSKVDFLDKNGPWSGFAPYGINNWDKRNLKMVICHFQGWCDAVRFHFSKNLPQNLTSAGRKSWNLYTKKLFYEKILKGVQMY